MHISFCFLFTTFLYRSLYNYNYKKNLKPTFLVLCLGLWFGVSLFGFFLASFQVFFISFKLYMWVIVFVSFFLILYKWNFVAQGEEGFTIFPIIRYLFYRKLIRVRKHSLNKFLRKIYIYYIISFCLEDIKHKVITTFEHS